MALKKDRLQIHEVVLLVARKTETNYCWHDLEFFLSKGGVTSYASNTNDQASIFMKKSIIWG